MNAERLQVLQMLSAGSITVPEAERLLSALAGPAELQGAAGGGAPRTKPKYLRVLVEDHSVDSDPTTVNVRVPLELLRAGLKLASIIPPQARDHLNEALQKQGLKIAISEVTPENLDGIVEQLDQLSVNVDSRASKVRVFCE
jgi:hypothetical protein